jgi:signal transduction histidine kinase/DNA-binding response OmpR family regulator
MRSIFGLILIGSTFISFLSAKAGERLSYDQFKIYADTTNLSFEELFTLEEKGEIQFEDYADLSSTINFYWIKIDPSILKGADYLLFSNFFDRIEAYSGGSTQPFSITGRLVDFENRSYKRGFYRHVLKIEKTKDPIYIKLISETGNSIYNRSLSHIEVCTAEDLGYQSKNILTTYTLLTGMELIILMINLFLIYLKPSKTGYSYAFFILTGIFLSNFNAQIFVDMIGMSAIELNYTELIIAVLIIYSFNLFTAYFLNVYQSSKTIHYILVFPIFPLVISSIFISNGHFFPWISTSYFLISLVIIIYSVAITWRIDSQKCKIFILANGLSILAALVMVLALSGFIVHHFVTTNAVFLGFILRDTLFTLNLFRNYFRLQDESIRRDVTIEKLREEKEQMKQIEILKTKFFNNVSHELRTPLTLILSPLENTIKNGELSDEVKKELNLSLKNGKYLLHLVNEMLDLAKLDKGELGIIRQPMDVVQVIKNIKETLDPFARQKRQTIFITHAHDSTMAMVDQDKFEKIMINLISNAIKYSDEPGNILIKVMEKECELWVEVSDEGRGISKKELPRIFDRFFQSATIKPEIGTGIGLSIVKEFVELHEGMVNCISVLGKGSTFSLCFPNSIQKDPDTDNQEHIENLIDASKLTLMIVEDHADMRGYLADKLTEYNIVEAADGESALKKLNNSLLPDLILTDYMMPEMDGYELAQQIKAQNKWANIPIIFLTARTLSEDKVKVLNLGVDDYIIKPFDLDELSVRIKNLLEISRQRIEFAGSIIPDLSIEKQKSFKLELDNYIIENLRNRNLSNTDMAYHFTVSERNFNRRVKLVTGQPPASYIREIRLQKARLLLESSKENTVSEIAYECGMENLAHFSQLFKKRFGKSPSEMKEHSKERFESSKNQ